MVWCSVPGCANYKQAQAAVVQFHWLPAEDIPRSRQWVGAMMWILPCKAPPHVHVCSQHFQSEDFETYLKSQLMWLPGRWTLKTAIPSIFPFTSNRKVSDQPTLTQKKEVEQRPSGGIAQCSPEVQLKLAAFWAPGHEGRGHILLSRIIMRMWDANKPGQPKALHMKAP